MKPKTLFVIAFFLIADSVNSQSLRWRMESEIIPHSLRFEDIYFIGLSTGWLIDFGGPVYKTSNSGNNWVRKGTVQSARSMGFFDLQTGIIGTLDTSKPLYRTINGGESYSVVSTIPANSLRNIGGISIANDNVAYACGSLEDEKIIKSTDKGASWQTVFVNASVASTIADCYFWSGDSGIAVGGYNTSFFAFGYSVIIRTIDGGLTWHRVYKSTRIGEWGRKISFITRNLGFVSLERDEGYSYILKTTNGGADWTEIPFGIYEQQGIGFINENTGWVGGWSATAYQTTNGGNIWQSESWGRNIGRFRFLNDTLAFATGDRVYKYSRNIDNLLTQLPESYSLSQNFPNPFNPITNIIFDIRDDRGAAQEVKMIVYDALGKVIATLVNENLIAGSYEVEFNGSNFPSGIYFYKLAVGEFSEVKKMTMIK